MLRLQGLRRFATSTASLYQTIVSEERAFPQLQRFMTFCDQMERFAQHQTQVQEHNLRRDHELRTCTFATREPVKSTLTAYIRYRKDFSSEHVVACLEWLADVVKARTDHFFTDLSVPDLFDDWRFIRILDDIRIGLQPGIFFPPDHIGRALKALASLGYKHTELMTGLAKKVLQPEGTPVNYSPTGTHVYTGFETNQDFQSFVQTILDWKDKAPNPFHHLDKAIQIANQANNYTKELAAALLNVSSQYYELIKAQRENPAFHRDSEIDEGLIQLQEILVKAGLMHPRDFDDLTNFVDLEVKMKRAERVFTDLKKSFSYLNPQINQELMKIAEENEPHNVRFSESTGIPDANELTARSAGVFAEGLAEMMTLAAVERDGSEYPNAYWRKKGMNLVTEKIPEVIERPLLALHLSKIWQQGLSLFSELLPKVKPLVAQGSTADLCSLLYGMAKGRVIDEELCKLIDAVPEKGTPSLNERVKGLFGAALTGHNEGFASILLSNFPASEIPDMDKTAAIQLAWSLCLLGKHDSPLLSPVLSTLHDESLLDKDLPTEISALAYDITSYLQLHLPGDKSIYIPQNYYENILSRSQYLHDPLKDLTLPVIRPLLGFNYTPAEAKLYKATMAAKTPSVYPVDDVITMNQTLAPVFLLGTDGFSMDGKMLLGYARMKQVVLEGMGYKPLMIPMHQVVNIDFSTGSFALNSDFNLRQIVTHRFGEFHDFLQEIDESVENLLAKLQSEEKRRRYISSQVFENVKEIMLLYKLQDALKMKTTPFEINEKIEEMKLQIVKINLNFDRLDTQERSFFEEIGGKLGEIYVKVNNAAVKSTDEVPEYLKPWVGLRQGMELPVSGRKDIDKELINQAFLWLPDYFHYGEWKNRLSRAYPLHVDMVLEATDLQNRTYFGVRRQLYGKTPNPMIEENALNLPISLEDRIIASLNNIKYELKRTKSDTEILNSVLDLEFIGSLITEHLGKNPGVAKPLLPRNPQDLMRLMEEVETQKTHVDPYTRFYQEIHLRESARDRLFTTALDDIQKVMASPDMNFIEKAAERMKIIDNYKAEYRQASQNDPEFDILFGDQKRQKQITVTDPDSWRAAPLFPDPDYLNSATDEEYLLLKRKKAEAKLIKASIIRQLVNEQPLSVGQTAYFEQWKADLKSLSPNSAGKSYLPTKITSLSIGNLSEKDANFLGSLRNVGFPEKCEVSLNELVLELSHFIDDEVINRVEFMVTEMNELRKWKGLMPRGDGRSVLKPEWENKEIALRQKEMEEQMWLQAGVMTPSDLQKFEEFFWFLKRNTRLGRLWYDYDIESWREFAQEANQRENCLDLMRSWYRRKEQQAPTSVPYGPFAKTDSALHSDFLAAKASKGKPHLEKLAQLSWDQITDTDICRLALNAVKFTIEGRLNRDENEDLFYAMLNHPSLSPRSKEVGYT